MLELQSHSNVHHFKFLRSVCGYFICFVVPSLLPRLDLDVGFLLPRTLSSFLHMPTASTVTELLYDWSRFGKRGANSIGPWGYCTWKGSSNQPRCLCEDYNGPLPGYSRNGHHRHAIE